MKMPAPKDPQKYQLYIQRKSESQKGRKMSIETRLKISKSQIGKPKPWLRGKSSSRKGVKLSVETKQKISRANFGRKTGSFSSEHIEKIRAALIGRVPWNKGKSYPFSEQHKKNISLATMGKKRSSETRRRMSEAHIGKPCPWLVGRYVGSKSVHFGKPKSEKIKQKLREARSKQIFPRKDTKPEKMMQIALSLNNIKFEKHKLISNKINGFYHQVDIFIEPNICIEIDGDYWHKRPQTAERDLIINHELNTLGYHILRIWVSDLEKNIQSHAENILKLIREKQEIRL